MKHEKELLKWLDEYYDKQRKTNFRKNIEDDKKRRFTQEKQERYHDYILRRYRESDKWDIY